MEVKVVVDRLLAAGVELTVHGELCSYTLDSGDTVALFLKDPEAFFALKEGVSPEDYRAWKRFNGSLQCAATVKSGARCKNMAHTELTPYQWARQKKERAMCSCHGKEKFTL